MEYRELGSTGLKASVIGLGTWVMGGSLWGGADDSASLAAIQDALDRGINLIDTAPIYGHGRSEKLVGRAIKDSGQRDRVIIATKVGLEWDEAKPKVWRNASRARILKEIDDSLRQLQTDVIDIYQVHWPDSSHPFEETMKALVDLRQQGKIRFIGVSNFSVAQMEACLKAGPVHVAQPPYNVFERSIETDILPFCRDRGVGTLVYGPLCRGLLSGKYQGHETFAKGDIRAIDPKFAQPRFGEYVACVRQLQQMAKERGKTVSQLAIRWCLDQPGVTLALCGARSPQQLQELVGAVGWSISQVTCRAIDETLAAMIPTPLGPEFMGPP